jgi:hypothetical protein
MTAALTSLCLLTSYHTIAAQSNSREIAENQARWFEIEVILFKQMSKTKDKEEKFSARNLVENNQQTFDLLTPYLQPDINILKQLLPNCEQEITKSPYNIQLSTLWAEKEASEGNKISRSDTDTVSSEAEKSRSHSATPTEEIDKRDTVTAINMSENMLEVASNKLSKESDDTSADKELIKIAYQNQYTNIELPLYSQYPSNSQKPICVIPIEFFQQHLSAEQLEQFSIDGFPVEKLTNTVNGLEQWQDDENSEITWASDKPYLISQDSLQLKSIANSIKRSRNYAPLLHLGWRQTGETKRDAKAMKLYAGKHLALDYQQAISARNAEQQVLEIKAIIEQRLQAEILSPQIDLVDNETVKNTQNGITRSASISTDNYVTTTTKNHEPTVEEINIFQSKSLDLDTESPDNFNQLSTSEKLRLQAKKQQLDNLFQQLSLLDNQTGSSDDSTDTTHEEQYKEEEVKRIVSQISADITSLEANLIVNNTTDNKVIITKPLQPWSVDGLFKVYLENRYLFIDTELNIVKEGEPPTVLSTKQSITNKNKKDFNLANLVSFKQDRRVISGEIHYFDHPHIGMIVQIRRFDPSKPADEAVTQAKK